MFTEHGALMAASVLNSPKSVEMSIFVVRAFVRLRQVLAANRQISAGALAIGCGGDPGGLHGWAIPVRLVA